MNYTKKARGQATFLITAAAAAGVVAAACVAPGNLHAGTIRHDRDDRVYQMMAYKEVWQAVGQMGQIQPNGEFFHSCTLALIDEQWVLCAAHCIVDIDPLTSVFDESPPPLLRIGTQLVQLTPADVFVHPGWIAGGLSPSVGYDIALFRLPAPLDRERRQPRPQGRQPATRQPIDPGRAIIPLRINTQRTEVGQRATSVGFGLTGTGLTGQNEAEPTSDRRAGVNVIDGTAVTLWAFSNPRLRRTRGNDQTLVVDFDSPLSPQWNTLGGAEPLNYEYSIASGDSGGPLFLPNGQIAGVVSASFLRPGGGNSTYGEVDIYTRVSSYRAWIQSVMAGNEPSFAVMIPRLRANGFFPGQPFRGIATPAMRQAREDFFQVLAIGWIPCRRTGRNLAESNAWHRNFTFPAPFNQQESNPLKTTVLTKSSDHLLGYKRGWDASEVSESPLSIECVSCGLNRVRQDHQSTENDSVTDSTPGEDTRHSVLVMPR